MKFFYGLIVGLVIGAPAAIIGTLWFFRNNPPWAGKILKLPDDLIDAWESIKKLD